MKSPTLCAQLVSEGSAPEGQDGPSWQRARAVLRGTSQALEAESLPEELLQALLDAAVEGRNTELVEALAASAHKAVAKAARHAQYRLKSAGVATRSPTPVAHVPVPEPAAAPELPSLLSPPDGAGEFLLMVARPIKGGLVLHEVVLSDELGLVAYREIETSRSEWRRSVREARAQPFREVFLEEARSLLAEGLRCNLATHSALPQGADGMLRRLQVEPATTGLPPLPAPEEGDATLALEAAALHEELELRGWLPPETELKLLGARVQELEASPLQLSAEQRATQLEERVRGMAQAFFTPERSRLYARRLWLTADVFARTGREPQAQLARAEARRLFHQAPGLFSRFAEALYTKLLQRPATGASAGASPGPGAAPGAATPVERRSPGGLILP